MTKESKGKKWQNMKTPSGSTFQKYSPYNTRKVYFLAQYDTVITIPTFFFPND